MKNIKLGCNWSSQLRKLFSDAAVKLDYIKTGVYGSFYEDFDVMLSLKPVLLHGLGNHEHTGMNNIEDIDFELANSLIEKCSSPHYGLHLSMKNANMYDGMTDDDVFTLMSEQTQIFKKKINVPLLLENIPDSEDERKNFDHYPFSNPNLISRFVHGNDTLFLLDLAHAKVAALYTGWDVREYIKALPIDKLKEIHVNGSGYDSEGIPFDAHQAMKDEDYELLKWVLTISKPDIVTLEYIGVEGESDEAIRGNLIEQLDRLNKIISNV